MIGVALTCVLQTALLTTGAQPYAEAYQKSQEENRPLMVMVGADWCPACVSMKQGVLARMQRSGKLRRVAFTIVDANDRLANKFMRGGSIPQLIVYHKTADGWRSERVIGGQSEAAIESMIERAVSDTAPVQTVAVEVKE